MFSAIFEPILKGFREGFLGLSALGCSEGSPGAILEPSWHCLGPSWDFLGPSWAVLRPSWSHLGPSWGPFWANLDGLVAVLGPSWADLGGLVALSGYLRAILSCPRTACCHLGPILEPYWSHIGPYWCNSILGQHANKVLDTS